MLKNRINKAILNQSRQNGVSSTFINVFLPLWVMLILMERLACSVGRLGRLEITKLMGVRREKKSYQK